ncbi:uracil-DNA glycosylase family protein [Winogradskyella immobilis]|uniref:Uracil-DNA glycosylase family protein n=1 Tax=Winogradskyella immobilis TaxID=2816852 RepID=A0ABS8EQZ2_9FLAO|nr:uracil-DNA glycosylase family protein [Winogradskyella immobilis]MCC1485417.1 uracil-DNA glycosylase family protein [Winogradskyella immobilis]MCG0017509.1 uracil-DNA glycosylase family protein [Winogradskyella immobilis]
MNELLSEISRCNICEKVLPLGPRPIVAAHSKSKILIIGQAPGSVVHKTGIPWDDKSGDNLRKWMGIDDSVFYDAEKIALIPMGFCYPGRGKTGDNPPTKKCAPKWHNPIIDQIESPKLILLIGKYAQDYYLNNKSKKTLTENVKNYQDYLPKYFVLPHPSPRNNIWQAKNEWFAKDVLPSLKQKIQQAF